MGNHSKFSILRRLAGKGYLPGYCPTPEKDIVIAYDRDFIANAKRFHAALPSPRVDLLLMLNWQHETSEEAEKLSSQLHTICSRWPELHVTVLANSPQEEQILHSYGVTVVLCHQNAFLDFRRYRLSKRKVRKYDAVYIARITPFKRHALASKIANLLIIGGYSQQETVYAEAVLRELNHATWLPKVKSFRLSSLLKNCNCGLCLSEAEGAMFAATEYLLCGLPVVNTDNLGGRNEMIPAFAEQRVADNPDAVAAGVQYWRNNPSEPYKIRTAAISLIEYHRAIFINLINGIYRERGIQRDYNKEWPKYFRHKMGIRCRIWPWTKWQHGIPESSAGLH